MRCVILGLDGCEHKFVEKINLKNLKQKEYGKAKIPKECYKEVTGTYFEKVLEPSTPLVWFSFLTGQLPPKDLNPFESRENEILQRLQTLAIKFGLDKIKGKNILRLLGLPKKYSLRKAHDIPTIFDLVEKSYALNVPFISENWSIVLGAKPENFNNFNDFIDFVLGKQLIQFDKIRNETLHFLKRNHDWNLFMVYSKILDAYGELSFSNTKQLFDIYLSIDSFVKQIKSLVDEKECLILAISDHGIERMGKTKFGKHSNYAFYSVNRRLDLNLPSITDFYYLLKKLLLA